MSKSLWVHSLLQWWQIADFLRCNIMYSGRSLSDVVEDPAGSILWEHPDDGSSRIFRNISTILPGYIASSHRKKEINFLPDMLLQLIWIQDMESSTQHNGMTFYGSWMDSTTILHSQQEVIKRITSAKRKVLCRENLGWSNIFTVSSN